VTASNDRWLLRCDGGARGNPGPGAFGYVLYDAAGAEVEARGGYLGHVTNNVAEYRALIAGLEAALPFRPRHLHVRADSLLVVNQLLGRWKVKHAGLRPLFEQARELLRRFEDVDLAHVRRGLNADADALVNAALDAPSAP